MDVLFELGGWLALGATTAALTLLVTSPVWGAIWLGLRMAKTERLVAELREWLNHDPEGVREALASTRLGLEGESAAGRLNRILNAYARSHYGEWAEYHRQGII